MDNIISFATLADLSPKKVNVFLQVGEKPELDAEGNAVLDDKKQPKMQPVEILFPMRQLSFYRVQEIINSVPTPTPTNVIDIEKTAGGATRRIYDYSDPEYQSRVTMAMHERNCRILLASWRQEDLAIPGETDEEKVRWIKDNLETGIMRQLIDALTGLSVKGEARIEGRAASF